MFSRLKSHIIAISGAIVALLAIILRVTIGQKKKAQERAQRAENSLKAIDKKYGVEKKAKTASDQAKESGDAKIKDAINRARSGSRDHFNQL